MENGIAYVDLYLSIDQSYFLFPATTPNGVTPFAENFVHNGVVGAFNGANAERFTKMGR